MAEFADQLSDPVMCEVLGVPRDDHSLFARWGKALTYVLSLEIADHLDEIAPRGRGLGPYVDHLVENRRAAPRKDLVTELVQAGEHGDRLSGRELRAMIGGLLFAGYDTTCNQLGHALFRFACFPAQWSILAERPELAGQAVDEVMRLHGAVVGVPRIAAAEVEVDGWVIPPGHLVFLSLASANRDDTVFDDPLRFDITAPATAPELRWGTALLPRRQPGPCRDGRSAAHPSGPPTAPAPRRRCRMAHHNRDHRPTRLPLAFRPT